MKRDYVVVGSGAGGATLARELSRAGKQVLVLERGRSDVRFGTVWGALSYYDRSSILPIPRHSREGVILWRAFLPGGTTVVSCGNGTPCLERELAALGIPLEVEIDEAMAEMGVTPVPGDLLSPASRAMRDVAAESGFPMIPMPKYIRPSGCGGCGSCVMGCVRGVKWTARDYLDEAVEHGAQVLCETKVTGVMTSGSRVRGVRARGPDGEMEIEAGVVVLAAGGLGTPAILQRSGIEEAGRGLFADLFVNVYGVCRGLGQAREPVMPLVCISHHEEEGFLLSPFMNRPRFVRFLEAGVKGALPRASNLVGIMIKTKDDGAGHIDADGRISKPVTEADRGRLDRGVAAARQILTGIGARARSLRVTRVQGAHPGGTAAIGKVVGADLQTRVEGLFVCDASVLPEAPGKPPIVTLVALAKHLGRRLASA
jgi:choline dehydrogenase-like flavoprotein